MTLKEGIERYKNNAEYERIHGSLQGCLDFRQLAEWLEDYERLLEQEPSVDVLEQIRNEIRQTVDEEQKHDGKWAIGLRYALKIIDNFMGE